MKWKSDLGLEARMVFTMFLLAVVYLVFLAVLISSGASTTVTVLFIGAFMFIQYFYSDKLVLWSMGAKVVSESEAPELHEIVTRLCITANLPKPRIAIINTNVPNALATGRSQSASVVAVTTGIMQRLNRSELEAVLAHELTHVKNRDAAVMTIATFLSSLAQLLVRWLPLHGRRRGQKGPEQLCGASPGLSCSLDCELHPCAGPIQVQGVCCRPRLGHNHGPALTPDLGIDQDQR